jgi:hypothetical protein
MNKMLLLAAKEFMKAYFSDRKEKRASDFDEDIIGGLDTNFMFGRPRWNNTIFFTGLGELVDEGVVKFKKLEDGQYVYWMPS